MQKKHSATRGFTLIELLVVIAIIGILSSVVLASLNTARHKGNDAAVKTNLDGVRTQAALYYDNNGNTYGASSVCTLGSETGMFTDATIKNAMAQIKTADGGTQPTCATSALGQDFAVFAPLTASGKSWCIDAQGASREVTTPTLATTTCPQS